MIIAIWTTNIPKCEAIKDWINNCPYLINIKNLINYIQEKVDSWVSDMPLSLEENMLWAKNRAKNLIKKWIIADFYIWCEWGTTQIWEKKYAWWIVYVENNKWEWHYWFSWMIEVPSLVEKKLYIDWLELWPIMNELSWKKDIWNENWSLWEWSANMLTRKDEFSLAFKAAIAPFFNKYYKM